MKKSLQRGPGFVKGIVAPAAKGGLGAAEGKLMRKAQDDAGMTATVGKDYFDSEGKRLRVTHVDDRQITLVDPATGRTQTESTGAPSRPTAAPTAPTQAPSPAVPEQDRGGVIERIYTHLVDADGVPTLEGLALADAVQRGEQVDLSSLPY